MNSDIEEANKSLKDTIEADKVNEIELDVSSRQKLLCNRAFTYLKKQREQICKMVTKLEGEIEKGDIIHLVIPAVNSTKVNGGNLTCFVINKIIHKKNAPSYHITCKSSVIKGIIQYHLLMKVLKTTPKLMGLTDMKETWTSQ